MIGKVIVNLLDADATLTAIVPTTKMFPYSLDTDTVMPALVYTIDGVTPEYSKDGWATDNITFSVYSLSKDYSQLMDIISAVRGALEWQGGSIEGSTVGKIRLTSMEETFDTQTYIFMNKQSFNVQIISY